MPMAGFACLFALATAGCSAASGDTSDSSGASDKSKPSGESGSSGKYQTTRTSDETSTTPTTSYAPYVSAVDASENDSAGSPTTYNLAFVIADGGTCKPTWNGTNAVDDPAVTSRISALTESGSTVRVSFGGSSGKELASACDSAEALAEAYGDALDAAGSTRADFDIEGKQLTDAASVALRSRAIALLQAERPGLEVTFTLPVMPYGLDEGALALLESANAHDVQVATVNIMTMNYSESYDGDMGAYAITSAKATQAQLKSVFGTTDATAWRALALTSMIGTNDVANETFTPADAAEVRAFAEEKGVAWVSMWSTFRDRQCAEGTATDNALTNCSGVKQSSGAFARAFSG